MSKELFIAMGIIVAFFLVAIGIYNKLVQMRNITLNSFGQIDVQIKRRHDLVPNLVEVAKKYMAHETETLKAVIEARSQATTAVSRHNPANPQSMAELAKAEGFLGGALGRLMVVSEAYPELKADAIMASLSEEVASTENRIAFSRQSYNDSVLDYNNLAEQFPNNIVAAVFSFKKLPSLQSTQSEAERQAPKISF